MKQRYTGWLLASGLMINTAVLQAADIDITVNGRVVARPCTVDTPNATIDLGDLYTFDFRTAGSTSTWHSVALNLSNCPIGTSRVVATFSGATDNTGYYRNDGTARNIQLELQDDNGTRLNNGARKSVQVNDSSLSTRFPLRVRAVSVNGRPSDGTIQAVINITYTYA
ncbi:fimbrial protein [Aeromonas cavernicola]|uniref:Fimbrial protein n=1 Tax=Aeromonas cavernicola TaxID=1006623 RepID=A0A2H9U645_9GAMM|nr:fimbrial protein [Aeromonas cavernicola]PJG59481.1 fimbrial protein [Aeromonas cavernicola]